MQKLHTGMSSIEIIVGVSIIAFVFLGLFAAFSLEVRTVGINEQMVKAGFLTEEGAEALRSIRDAGWTLNITPLSTTTTYYLAFTGGKWGATTTATTTDGVFTRTFIVEDVVRNGSDQIAASGTYDPNIKKFTISTTWTDPKIGTTTTRTIKTYLTNIFDN